MVPAFRWRRWIPEQPGMWGILTLLIMIQAAAVWIWIHVAGVGVAFPSLFDVSTYTIVLYMAGALTVRLAVAAIQERSLRAGATKIWCQPIAWLWTAFIFVVVSNTYAYAKLMVPALNPHLWDAELAALDRFLLGGVDANVLLMSLATEGPRWVAPALDVYYSFFLPTTLVASAWFATSEPRFRFPFLSGLILLWSLGFWVYIAVPALGPVFVYPGLLAENYSFFTIAAQSQRVLLDNYQRVQLLLSGEQVDVVRFFGVAAMPSMHVAAHGFFFLWSWRFAPRARVLLGVMTLLTFLGSVALGWHYAVDGYVGILMAVIAFVVAVRLHAGSHKGP